LWRVFERGEKKGGYLMGGGGGGHKRNKKGFEISYSGVDPNMFFIYWFLI